MSKTAFETATDVTDLTGYLASRGGVADTFPQAGSPLPGENGPTLMGARCQQDGHELPMAKNDIGSLVSSKPSVSQTPKMGG